MFGHYLLSYTLQFPGVEKFAEQIKVALIQFDKGDLVYLTTKNIKLQKGLARKLAPKFIGPYKIVQNFGNNTFKIDLPTELKRRGVHPSFHASLLRIHNPNDDRLFPGRLASQIGLAAQIENEWKIERIEHHNGTGSLAQFQVVWTTGDKTWLPYDELIGTQALEDYFEILGIASIQRLTAKMHKFTSDLELATIQPCKEVLETYKRRTKIRNSNEHSQSHCYHRYLLIMSLPTFPPQLELEHAAALDNQHIIFNNPFTGEAELFSRGQCVAIWNQRLRICWPNASACAALLQ